MSSNILDRIKTFSFLAEARTKSVGDVKIMLVEVAHDKFTDFLYNVHTTLNAVDVIPFPSKKNTYAVVSASGTYDSRAIYAAFVVAGQSQSSDITWRFVQRIFSAEQQPEEGGATDLSNDQLAALAAGVGAPQPALDLIRIGLPIGHDARVIAANNLALLHQFPEPAVPLVVIDGQPVDGTSEWLGQVAG